MPCATESGSGESRGAVTVPTILPSCAAPSIMASTSSEAMVSTNSIGEPSAWPFLAACS
jgi:hypothetical protein